MTSREAGLPTEESVAGIDQPPAVSPSKRHLELVAEGNPDLACGNTPIEGVLSGPVQTRQPVVAHQHPRVHIPELLAHRPPKFADSHRTAPEQAKAPGRMDPALSR